jgi:hypothetical protein
MQKEWPAADASAGSFSLCVFTHTATLDIEITDLSGRAKE